MTGIKKVLYPLSVAVVLLILAVTSVISWQAFAWGGGIAVAVAILLAVIEMAKTKRTHI